MRHQVPKEHAVRIHLTWDEYVITDTILCVQTVWREGRDPMPSVVVPWLGSGFDFHLTPREQEVLDLEDQKWLAGSRPLVRYADTGTTGTATLRLPSGSYCVTCTSDSFVGSRSFDVGPLRNDVELEVVPVGPRYVFGMPADRVAPTEDAARQLLFEVNGAWLSCPQVRLALGHDRIWIHGAPLESRRVKLVSTEEVFELSTPEVEGGRITIPGAPVLRTNWQPTDELRRKSRDLPSWLDQVSLTPHQGPPREP
tara:strand:- start:16092 stop:16853 length:762 start_codon:yes stop_codon:yes gene_type:complete